MATEVELHVLMIRMKTYKGNFDSTRARWCHLGYIQELLGSTHSMLARPLLLLWYISSSIAISSFMKQNAGQRYAESDPLLPHQRGAPPEGAAL